MKIAIYGGSFNPPHLGHTDAALAAEQQISPDEFLLIPAAEPPHKSLAEGSPGPETRLLMTQMMARDIPGATVSDIELHRTGKSYTSDTVEQLLGMYPGAELFLVVGTDMLLYFEQWHDFRYLLDNVTIAVFARDAGEEQSIKDYSEYLQLRYGARVAFLPKVPMPVSSTEIRDKLRVRSGRDMLKPEIYGYIIQNRLYGAKPELKWLREKTAAMLKPERVAHVAGCEKEAVSLAERWGADRGDAAEAAILHDITKKLSQQEQLILCKKYAILTDSLENSSKNLLHSKTGAAVARDLFGITDEVYSAVRWHTTGRAGMTLLDKIIYLADCIEPTRTYDGVDKLRRLAYEDLDAALILSLERGIDCILATGNKVHKCSAEALAWLNARRAK